MKLKNKLIVITGGTSGIGLELVRALYTANTLFVMARPSMRLNALKQEFPGVRVIETDLADGTQVAASCELILNDTRQVDILINNAAIQNSTRFTDEEFEKARIAGEIAVNLTTPCQLIAHLLPKLLAAPQAVILNVNSGLALVPKTSSAVYCGTKGGLNIFSQSLANQLEGTRVSVKQVFLPLVETEMTAGRGGGKLTAGDAAGRIIKCMEKPGSQIDIGKVKLLRLLNRFVPSVARHIMKTA